MSVQSEIDRINSNVQTTLQTIADTGVAVGTNSDALPAAAAALANEKAAAIHAAQHASGGADPITPASIGAVPASEKGVASGVATLDANRKVTAAQATSKIISVTASKTLAASDAGTMQYANPASGASIVFTIPADASNAIFQNGAEIEFYNHGAGTYSIKAESGLYIAGGGSNTSGRTVNVNRYGCAALKRISSTVWAVAGDIA